MLKEAVHHQATGEKNLHAPNINWETAPQRIKELRDFLLDAPQQLAPERLECLLEVYKEYRGEAPIYIRAKLFEKLLTTKPLFLDGNPIVGTMTGTRAGVYAYPEWNVAWIRNDLDRAMMSHLGEVKMPESTRKLLEETYEFWNGHTTIDRANALFEELYGIDPRPLFRCGAMYDGCSHSEGLGVADYPRVLNEGMGSILKDVEERLQRLLPPREANKNKIDFYRAAIIVLKAAIAMANRYADLAEETAAKETDPKVRAELLDIAEVCRRVPEHPARTLREAMQSFWFVHLCLDIDQMGCATSPGRYGLYMDPFYQNDLREGRLTREQALTLLKFQWIRHLEVGHYQGQDYALLLSGHTGQTISIGGVTADGQDATTEMDELLLETQIAMKNVQPTLSLFYHRNMKEEFLNKVVELIRCGTGQPQIMNNDVAIARNLSRWSENGITLEDARNVANFGCVATGVCGKSTLNHIECIWNMAKPVELALNNGFDPVTKKQIGPQTGDPESFETFEDFYSAFKTQMDHIMHMNRLHSYIGNMMRDKVTPCPFRSVMIGGCIERGDYEQANGPYYPQSVSISCAGIDAANSLNALRDLVYERKKISMKDLREALAANFEGFEDIQKMCLNAPKHGNDDLKTDELTRRMYADAADLYDFYGPDYAGRKGKFDAYSMSIHNYMGKLTGALPSGRKGGVALTDGSVSATPGTDHEGVTALVNSAARVIDTVRFASNHCNVKFHPSALEGPDGARMLLGIIRSYCDMGGSHIQFNCVSSDTLVDAQKHPENYKDLVVRVAGFSAYFTRLDKGVQDEIIKRTEYKSA